MSDPNYLLHDGEDAPSSAPASRHCDFSVRPVRGHHIAGARASTGHTAAHASRDPGLSAAMAETTCTETADGRVRHLLVELHDGTFFRAPVKIIPPRSGMGAMARPHPQRHASGYVYALPGGKEIEA